MNNFWFIRLMGKYPVPGEMVERKIVWADAQIWGVGGEICASGAPGDFSRSYDMATHLRISRMSRTFFV